MKPLLLAVLPALLICTACVADGPGPNPSQKPTENALYAANELLVRFADDISPADARRRIAAFGGTILESQPERGFYRIRTPTGMSVPEAARRLGSQPGVVYTEPNYRHRPYR